MFESVPVSAQPQPRGVRRPMRLIWVVAVSAGVAVGFGTGVVEALNSGSSSVTATPAPCNFDQTCDEETHIAIEEMQGDELAAECDRLRVAHLPLPPVCYGL